jgi:predicted nucleic acid-binding protein
MIHLDTNYLAAMAVGHSDVAREVVGWLQRGQELGTSAIAWSEFLTGSLKGSYMAYAERALGGGIVPFGSEEARCAAALYQELRLKREQRVDCFIAATALVAGATLATRNRRDFVRFVPRGLKLA